ncbi:MAG TPA: hypothetical protein VF573_22185 [Paraburkholderia sp.]|uniref:hypothetical protein n=1 Tax=Paraburkholderia sp. TaxID=1926495 RepID=UPI002ED59173
MKGGVWPNVRMSVITLAVAGTLAGTLGPTPAHAQPSADRAASERASRLGNSRASRHSTSSEHPASDVMLRTAVPSDLDQRRRDGHMTPDERRLLRQHIEDAVRELYKR